MLMRRQEIDHGCIKRICQLADVGKLDIGVPFLDLDDRWTRKLRDKRELQRAVILSTAQPFHIGTKDVCLFETKRGMLANILYANLFLFKCHTSTIDASASASVNDLLHFPE